MNDTDVAVILARLELKIDQLMANAGDHETRLRALEGRGFVSGKQLWAGLLGMAAVLGSLGTVAAFFLGH